MTDVTRWGMVSFGLLLIRVFLGLGIAAHGYQKLAGEGGLAGFTGYLTSLGVPYPQYAAYLSVGAELVGGVLLAVGFLTRFVALALAINMFVAVITVHRTSYFLDNQPPGMEYALNLGIVFLALVFTGPGRYSIDNRLFRRRVVLVPTAAPVATTSVVQPVQPVTHVPI